MSEATLENKLNLTETQLALASFDRLLAEIAQQEELQPSVGDDSHNGVRWCIACEDAYPRVFEKVTGVYCPPCYKEKKFGVIPEGTVHVGFGSPFYVKDESDNPWLENARRVLEGD